MNAFLVEVKDQPGQLAWVTEALAAEGVNILVYGYGVGDAWGIAFVPSDADGARKALGDLGASYTETPLVFVRMQDRPGQAAATSRKLADAGINIEIWLPVDTTSENFTVALGVSDAEAAKRALADQIITWTYA